MNTSGVNISALWAPTTKSNLGGRTPITSKGRSLSVIVERNVRSCVEAATVVTHGRGEKVKIFKMRRRKHYQKHQGHRQGYTELKIDAIVA